MHLKQKLVKTPIDQVLILRIELKVVQTRDFKEILEVDLITIEIEITSF